MLDADAIISAIAAAPSETVLLADFDGTMSAIVEHADDAVALPGVVEVLASLVPRFGRLGIVSGRPVEFLVDRLPVPGLVFAGLYGLEHVDSDGTRQVDPRAEPFLAGVAAAADELEARLPGVFVERKAGVTVTAHWRPTPGQEDEVRAVALELATRFGLEQLATRMAIELRPPVPVDKGTATTALVGGFRAAVFAGDDSGDIAAFDAIASAVRAGGLERGVRIAVLSPEMPPELAAHVDATVDGPEAFVALLRRVREKIG